MAVARELFKELPAEVCEEWRTKARDAASHNKVEYLNLLKAPPSKDPIDRQECINNLPAFVAPLLKGIHERTGLHVFMFMGGVMPKQKGELGTFLSWGKNFEPNPVTWPQWDEDRFKENVQDFYIEYLRTAYSDEDRERAKLLESSGHTVGLSDSGLYTFDDELKGVNQDLNKVSDSSSEDSESEAEQPQRKRKCRVVADDSGKRVTKGGKKSPDHNDVKDNQEPPTPLPKKSTYEIQREANIVAIANDPRIKEINAELAQMHAEHHPPCAKPKPHVKYLGCVAPVRKSERLAPTAVEGDDVVITGGTTGDNEETNATSNGDTSCTSRVRYGPRDNDRWCCTFA
ncbi:hypothetical protein EV421DRAFT_1744766 [Armillaria borealis]|uniref:Uncharacterized protein n=1 Tax=Armillaria borealis TaxID=47425 RepID=A0AA39IUE5_9AGAR|nr:hypothetical protein EV421DRAFT_1744766 [Armillaria borealis]